MSVSTWGEGGSVVGAVDLEVGVKVEVGYTRNSHTL